MDGSSSQEILRESCLLSVLIWKDTLTNLSELLRLEDPSHNGRREGGNCIIPVRMTEEVRRECQSPGVGVPGDCKLLNMGAGNQVQIFCKSGTC